ncbi:MAG: hypothetical protein FWH27_06245 [Planctomycetaceae bacterium]|nr:hypothetical protein [Planctomycetaceae bacterium]
MSELLEKLETFCKQLEDVHKTLKKAGKSRSKKTDIADVRKLIRESASVIEKSLADIENDRPCKPGVSKSKHDEMVETAGCYKCACKTGMLMQWLSPKSGHALRRFSVVCENCWNLAVRERTRHEAIAENQKMNRTLQR